MKHTKQHNSGFSVGAAIHNRVELGARTTVTGFEKTGAIISGFFNGLVKGTIEKPTKKGARK